MSHFLENIITETNRAQVSIFVKGDTKYIRSTLDLSSPIHIMDPHIHTCIYSTLLN